MRERAGRLAQIARITGSTVVALGLLVLGLPLFADLGEAWDQVRNMPASSTALLAVATALNLVTYWWLLVASLPGLKLSQAAIACEAATAVNNVLPAGAAVGASVTWGIYRSYGFSGEQIGRSLSVTAFWNAAVKLVTPALALVLLASGSDAPPTLLVVVSLAIILVALTAAASVLKGDSNLDRLVALAAVVARRRPRAKEWVARLRTTRDRSVEMIKSRWLALSVSAVASHTALFVVLLLCVRAVGIGASDLGLGEVVTAFAIVRVTLLVPVTPGGAGVAEVGLTGLLTAAGGEAPAVVGAVLLFRALTWLLPIPLGALAYAGWLLGRRRVMASAGTP